MDFKLNIKCTLKKHKRLSISRSVERGHKEKKKKEKKNTFMNVDYNLLTITANYTVKQRDAQIQ